MQHEDNNLVVLGVRRPLPSHTQMEALRDKTIEKVGIYWWPAIVQLFKHWDGLSRGMASSIYVRDLGRRGSNLWVEYSCGSTAQGGLIFTDSVRHALQSCRAYLKTICPTCGKKKGEPASSTMQPALCEACRANPEINNQKNSMLIAMIGKAGSGKDSCAKILTEEYGFVRRALADPIRDIVQTAFALDRDTVWDRKLREKPLRNLPDWSVRRLLQFVGTELFRDNILASIWIENFLWSMDYDVNYVITDIRFPNEKEFLVDVCPRTPIFIKVVRPGYDGRNVGIANHASEAHDIEGDITLINDGGLADLEVAARVIFNALLKDSGSAFVGQTWSATEMTVMLQGFEQKQEN